ncbi:hypothetical protein MD484_g8308, partial [Candolleomyces efflorescens]
MALALQSEQICLNRSTVLQRRTLTMVRPGAPLMISSLALGQALEAPKKNQGVRILRSVVHLACKKAGEENAARVVVASLVPEKVENFTCHIVLFPGAEYTFEVYGNPVHVFGQFMSNPDQDDPPTEVRLLVKGAIPRQRSTSVLSAATSATASSATPRASSIGIDSVPFTFRVPAGAVSGPSTSKKSDRQGEEQTPQKRRRIIM